MGPRSDRARAEASAAEIGGTAIGIGGRGNEGFEKRVEAKRPQLEKYEALCKELGEEPANVALAWLLHNPVVTAPIIGPRTMEQLTGVLKVPEIKLFKLSQVAEAQRVSEGRHFRGKLVFQVK